MTPAARTIHLDARALHPTTLSPPPSKSDAQRALVIAHALGQPRLAPFDPDDPALPNDVRIVASGLAKLRAGGEVEIHCADGGAPFRFLLAQAAISECTLVRFVGSARLGQRPHAALFSALQNTLGPAGMTLRTGTPWPVEIAPARMRATPLFQVRAAESSQFASALILAAAALAFREQRAWSVDIDGPMASPGYLALTLRWIEHAGFRLVHDDRRVQVFPPASPPVCLPPVPGDWSSLAYLLLMAWRSDSEVTHIDPTADHPDRSIVDLLSAIGLRVHWSDGRARVRGIACSGLQASAHHCPDLLPTLAVLACALPGSSFLHQVGILRTKESDRLEGIVRLVTAAGGRTQLQNDTLRIDPPRSIAPWFTLTSEGDHRMAMCAAILTILGGSQSLLTDPDCVDKSFPGFWRQVVRCGVKLSSTHGSTLDVR